MKGIYGILILFVVVLFVSACASDQQTTDNGNSQNPSQMPDKNGITEPVQKDEVAVESIPMSDIYDYSKLSKFVYDLTTTASGKSFKTTVDYELSSDNVNGKEAWLSTSRVDSEGTTILSKIWTDKVNFGCLKISSVVIFNDQEMETPAECPKEGPNAATTATETPMVNYLGDETVTVPLGTFNTKKYSLDNTVTYYYASGVPIPVKVTYGDDTVMELVKWS